MNKYEGEKGIVRIGIIYYPARSGERQSSFPDLMSDRTDTLTLANGATVALSEYGDRDGVPVFFCHGWPSSRTMAELADEAARDLGLRIISPDRPGIRDSTFQRKRQLIDWPSLLSALADLGGQTLVPAQLSLDRSRSA